MSNALSLLMNVNQEKLKKPTKEVEVPRLSEIVEKQFNVTVKALNMAQLKEVLSGTKTDDIISNFESSALVVRYGMLDPLVTNKDLQAQMGVQNWEELLNKLFLPGEVMTISQEILSISDLDGSGMKKKKSAKAKKAETVEE